MTDNVTFETGALPWKPSADSVPGEVYHRFTIPLVGTFTQGGNHFLYWCVVGHAGPEQAWGYASVSSEEAESLRGAGDFGKALSALVDGRATGFAISTDDDGIRIGVDIDPPAEFFDLYRYGMTCIHNKIQKAIEEYQALERMFPLMQPPSVAPSVGTHRAADHPDMPAPAPA